MGDQHAPRRCKKRESYSRGFQARFLAFPISVDLPTRRAIPEWGCAPLQREVEDCPS